MNDTQLDAFIKEKATETGIDETVLKSAIVEKKKCFKEKKTLQQRKESQTNHRYY